jgi:hypothetical protein
MMSYDVISLYTLGHKTYVVSAKMPENEEYKFFDPENDSHRQVRDAVKKYLQRREERIDEKDLVDEIQPILSEIGVNYSDGHTRNLLRDIRKVLEKQGVIKVEEEARGGIEAVVYIPQS